MNGCDFPGKEDCQLFGFPNSGKLRTIWLEQLNYKEFDVSEKSKICEKHFENQCFLNEEDNFTKTGKKRKGKSLLSWSFPTLFLDSKKRKLNDFYDRTESFDTIHKEEVEVERMKEESSTHGFASEPLVSIKTEIQGG